MPAPLRNANAIKNGTRIQRLIVGNLPPRLVRVQRYVRQYRQTLEDAVIEAHGEVDIVAAHVIDAAVTHEQRCQVCRWLLREKLDEMAIADIRECSKQIAASKDSRNRCLQQLELRRDATDTMTALYSRPDDMERVEARSATNRVTSDPRDPD